MLGRVWFFGFFGVAVVVLWVVVFFLVYMGFTFCWVLFFVVVLFVFDLRLLLVFFVFFFV